MMRLPTIALGALALSATSFTALADDDDARPTGRARVIFTDVKFDDKVAVKFLLEQKDYDKVLVVFSGLKDMNAANGDLHDFLAKAALGENADAEEIAKFTLDENVKFVKGHSIDTAETHEANFLGEPRSPDDTFENIIKSGFLDERYNLNVTQIAPTPMTYINDLADKLYIDMYHLVHGHNSKHAEFDWLKNLQSMIARLDWDKNIQSMDLFRPSLARVVATSNFASFVSLSSGSNHLLKSFDGKVPVEHLQSALKDPFHASQMLKMDDFIKEACKVELDVSLKPTFETDSVDVEMAEARVNVNKVELGELVKWVVEARKNETDSGKALRTHFKKYIQNVIDRVEAGNLLEKYAESLNVMDEEEREVLLKKFPLNKVYNLYERFSKHVKDVFEPETPLTVQLCDANHVASVFKADVAAYKPFVFKKDEKGIIAISEVADNRLSHGRTLQGLDGTTVLKDLIDSFGGHQHSTILEAEEPSAARNKRKDKKLVAENSSVARK